MDGERRDKDGLALLTNASAPSAGCLQFNTWIDEPSHWIRSSFSGKVNKATIY